ncbi:protein XRI1-like isoform X1 [Zingiber officinale]|uniref:Protein XRI1 n=1 Tax=Zingiber officinale TaxID=94328 RepID=A0A8J5KU89_ZINOF|nr:protein XRI1-like isoform X1 [Zingiber officinale]KAG6493340.1 hypothetical protein ZIOFF_048322 [Zingiber officinale]
MMAMDNYFLFPPRTCDCDWDPHTSGSADDLRRQLMPSVVLESPASSSQASTGYLQDAVAEWSLRSKRRRLTSPCPQDILQGFCFGDLLLDQNCMPSDQPGASSSYEKSLQFSRELQRKDSSDSNSKPKPVLTAEVSERRACGNKQSVAYPFAVVKPGGLEGDVTLADINERIFMRPKRPVRHPVGEFAGGPCVVSPAGPGLSGKAVVSLTRIQTRGRGTITIIRTKG